MGKKKRKLVTPREKDVSLVVAAGMDASKHSNYLDYEWSIVLNRIIMKCVGIWPDKEKKSILDAYVVFILLFVIFNILIPSLHSFIRIWGDLLLMIDNLQYTLPMMMAILKAFIIWRKKEKLIPILNMFKKDWLKLKTKKERNVMIRRARTARLFTICGYIMIFLLIIICLTLPSVGITLRYVTNVTDQGKPLPLPSYYIYDTSKSPLYEITVVLQSVCAFFVAIMYSGTDTFMGLLVFHVCGQLENLRERVPQLDMVNFDSALSYNVRDHRRIIRSIQIIDDTFTIMLLGLLVYFGILFILYGFLIDSMIRQSSSIILGQVIFTGSCFVGTFTHMCLYCILGEILVIQCDGVYDVICEYKWYKLEPKRAKDLLPIMIRASKPLYLTAGKLFPMTMSTLCSLLKTSGGYISVLLAQRE